MELLNILSFQQARKFVKGRSLDSVIMSGAIIGQG